MKNELLVSDANILIDFYLADSSLIKILCDEFHLKIPKVIMDEIKQFTYAEALAFGIEIIDSVNPIDSSRIMEPKKLSFQDKACANLSLQLSASCLTNDKVLKTYLDKQGIKTYWGLEMLLLLTSKKSLSKEKTTEIANKIFLTNYWYSLEIQNGFWEKLKLL